MTTINLPLKIILPRVTKKDRTIMLNLNIYRNLHYIVNNQVKKAFKEQIQHKLTGLSFNRVQLHYVLYRGSARMCDVSNICCMIDKYFCDAMVESGVIEDDNYNHVPYVTYKFGGIDKENPRCEVYIEELPS